MGGETDYGPPRPRMGFNESESEFRRRENEWYMGRYHEWWKNRQRELANRTWIEHLIYGIQLSIKQSEKSKEEWKRMDEEQRLKTVKEIFSKAEKGCKTLSERKEIPPKLQEALKKGADTLGKANKALNYAEKAMDLYDAAHQLKLFFESNPLKDQAQFAKRAGGALVAVGKIMQLSKFKPLQEAGKALMGAGSFFENCANAWRQSEFRLKSMRRELGPSNYLYDKP